MGPAEVVALKKRVIRFPTDKRDCGVQITSRLPQNYDTMYMRCVRRPYSPPALSLSLFSSWVMGDMDFRTVFLGKKTSISRGRGRGAGGGNKGARKPRKK